MIYVTNDRTVIFVFFGFRDIFYYTTHILLHFFVMVTSAE